MTDKHKEETRDWLWPVLGIPLRSVHLLLPGLLLSVGLAWLSIWLSRWIGVTLLGFGKSPVSSVMVAVLLGMIVGNIVRLPSFLTPGLVFTVKKVLKLGIIVMGIRLSLPEVFRMGMVGVPVVMMCIIAALIFTGLVNRWLKLPRRLGTLIAVGTSICGVSAIVAMAPAIQAEEEEVSYAVAIITVFGLFATVIYPYLAQNLFAGDPARIGIFLGTSVHDTSQVTGSALVYIQVFSQARVLDIAVVTKLIRNVFMIAVIPLMTLYYSYRNRKEAETGRTKLGKFFPLFIIGFLALAAVRSVGDATLEGSGAAFGLWSETNWAAVHGSMKSWAVNLLVVALSGVGLGTNFRTIKKMGIKPFLVGLAASGIVGLVSFGAISLLGILNWIRM